MNIKLNFDAFNIIDTTKNNNVKVLMLKGEKGEKGDPGETILVDEYTTSNTEGYVASYLNEHTTTVSANEPTSKTKVFIKDSENLFDKSDITSNIIIDSEGNELTNNNFLISNYIEVLPNTTYTISYESSDYTWGFRVVKYNSNKVFTQRIVFQDEVYTFKTNGDTKYLRINSWKGNTKIQLKIGSTAGAFEEYIENPPILVLKGGVYKEIYNKDNMGDLAVDSIVSKQLFDKDDTSLILTNAYFNNSTGGKIASYNNASTMFIPCESNRTYVIEKIKSARYCVGTTSELPKVGVSISQITIDNDATSISITTDSNAKYLVVFYYLGAYDTLSEEMIRNSIIIKDSSFKKYGYNEYTNMGKLIIEKINGKNVCDGISQNYFLNVNVNGCGYNVGDTGLAIKTNGVSNFTISTLVSQAIYRVACSNTLPTTSATITTYNGINKDGTSGSITINTNGYKYLIVNATNLKAIQVEKGTKATSYQDPNTIQMGRIVVDDIQSKNDFNAYECDWSSGERTTYSLINTNKVVINSNGNWARRNCVISGLKPNTKYTISANKTADVFSLCGFYINNQYSYALNTTDGKIYLPFTTDANGNATIQFYTNFSDISKTNVVTYSDIQVEPGSEATNYTPHKVYGEMIGWNRLALTSGNNDVALPTSFKELLAVVTIGNNNYYYECINIPREILSTTKRGFNGGYYQNSNNYGAVRIFSTDTTANLDYAYNNGNAVTSQSYTVWFYR